LKRVTILTLVIAASLLSAHAQKTTEIDFGGHFEKYGVKGCFVLYNESENEYIRYNTVTCDSGYIPASTFKIPHALIALEEGIISDTAQVIKWDGREWPSTGWNQDQTLKTSFKFSCVWVYTGFADKISADAYNRYVRAFDYGNKDLTGPPNRFWLAGLFRISANQQVEFLHRFYRYKLPASGRSVNMVKDCIVLEKSDQYIFSGKTGGGRISETDYVMWLVGYIEQNGKTYFYAMNFRSDDFNKTAPFRYEITKSILKELGLL